MGEAGKGQLTQDLADRMRSLDPLKRILRGEETGLKDLASCSAHGRKNKWG